MNFTEDFLPTIECQAQAKQKPEKELPFSVVSVPPEKLILGYKYSEFHYFYVENKLDSVFTQLGPWLAGGSVRRAITGESMDGADYDFYCQDQYQFDKVKNHFEKLGYVHTKANHLQYQMENRYYKIQIVHYKFFDTLKDVFDSFDFTICQFGFDGFKILFNVESLVDLRTKTLKIHRVREAMASMHRGYKYHLLGYKIDDNFARNILECSKEQHGEDGVNPSA